MIPEGLSKVSELALVSFRFRHKGDWTLWTRMINAHFISTAWYPIIDYANIEVINVKWIDKGSSIHEYFTKLSKRGLIYDVGLVRKITSNMYLVGFMGPYRNTVRERLILNNILYFKSTIHDGVQDWLILAPLNKVNDFKESLKNIGKLVNFRAQPITNIRDIMRIIIRNNNLIDYVKLALTNNELKTLRSAWELKYFDLNNRSTLSEVSAALNKDKSTVDRQIKESIRKIIYYIMSIM
ncbi:helix-turn-helix domain-containing protein [Caldivirga maquilingensis]|uniref:Bacterio-opsin activator HTH domain protein n=1 Tax=Caldivirga maquilingensis (strain ATCC 700844 / DSM 13496 / JCM 10307 / IC-167) TaxID=397948 RepID=A8M9K5_CALMQ|nr:helix-turn-helix domain-containing protein [Caldivirga maquilingensis]ABW00886.1 Bacterio-opsin activator HTH domain protein [Caldivirga maquilingensis IC-167]